VTVLQGAFVRFAAFEVAGRLLGVLGQKGAVAAPDIDTFQKSNGLGEPGLKLSKVSAANKHLGPRSKMQTNILDRQDVRRVLSRPCDHAQWTIKAAARDDSSQY